MYTNSTKKVYTNAGKNSAIVHWIKTKIETNAPDKMLEMHLHTH
eukprot:SAG11_NODE_27437_length_332_cov_2.278970_2_plen_43_part_01